MSIETDARRAALTIYSHANVRDRYDADLLMAGFADGALWAREQDTREPSEAEVEAGCAAFYEGARGLTSWDRLSTTDPALAGRYRDGIRAALLAAQEGRNRG